MEMSPAMVEAMLRRRKKELENVDVDTLERRVEQKVRSDCIYLDVTAGMSVLRGGFSGWSVGSVEADVWRMLGWKHARA